MEQKLTSSSSYPSTTALHTESVFRPFLVLLVTPFLTGREILELARAIYNQTGDFEFIPEDVPLLLTDEWEDHDLFDLYKIPDLKHLILLNNTRFTAEGLASLANLTQLTKLKISGLRQDSGSLSFIASLTRLEYLELEALELRGFSFPVNSNLTGLVLQNCAIRETIASLANFPALTFLQIVLPSSYARANLENLAQLQQLEELRLLGAGVEGNIAALVRNNPNLHLLDLANCQLNRDDMKSVAALTSLSELYLRCTSISANDLAPIAGMKTLRRLDLSAADLVNSDFSLLSKLELVDLDLSYSYIASLVYLTHMTSLTHLGLEGCTNLTQEGVANLAQLSRLSLLRLGGTNLSYTILSEVGKLSRLTELGIRGLAGDVNASLVHLTKLSQLRFLNVSKTNLSNVGLAQLAKITSLTGLDLSSASSSVNDAGAAQLSQLTALRRLELRHFRRLTVRGVASLACLPSLELLNITDCNRVRLEKFIQQLEEGFPSLKYVYIPHSPLPRTVPSRQEVRLLIAAEEDCSSANEESDEES